MCIPANESLNYAFDGKMRKISLEPVNENPEILCEVSPQTYFSRFKDIYGSGRDVFLMNPFWSENQRCEAEKQIYLYIKNRIQKSAGKIFIASGGSGGKIRFIAHTSQTLEASARALISALNVQTGTPVNCFCCLPPWHVSGLMPWVRSRVGGGRIFIAEKNGFHAEESLPEFRKSEHEFWMNSLVPTQLHRLLNRPGGADWLRKFDFILLGGARVPGDLIARAQAENISFGIGYGMTETASLVALWRPQDGATIAGTPLPHAKFFISRNGSRITIASESLGETLSTDGRILPNPDGHFLTNDEGRTDEHGRLVVLGRADRYINSGGEKIDPLTVENALRAAGAADSLVTGVPDDEWGECAVALVKEPLPENLFSEIKKTLPAWMIPKRFIRVPALPFDGKGKLDREKLSVILHGGKKSERK